ncbi:efflux RND transporter permease subunit [Glaciecola sp. KUL10]|uniref:efflux RND transporter permease subunit n=1 Tax=Glaciecola sp. (strain KUL10) TaxID=2161813 RepID=UPI000D7874CF|nr:efflux RND transporter permease subunit [Glaciecola sp. KUL10]GBL05931.1 cation/multidrug efflux pump [Glaciecola sp. KUL10]
MNQIIDAAFARQRSVALVFLVLVVAGFGAYINIPKEAEPDIAIPIIYASVNYEGIAPQDAERLLVRPLEKELKSIEGLKEMRSTAAQGFGSVTLEFDAGFDADKALLDVREKVDLAKAELPPGSDEPRVTEVNVSLFPVLTVVLSGPVPERTLLNIAQRLKLEIESLSGVLEVDIGGDREELLEVLIDPQALETYNLSFTEVLNFVSANNRLVAAGAIDDQAGRMVFKVPGVIENLQDLASLPVKKVGNIIVTFDDVASIRRSFKDPNSLARIQGENALALEVSKRTGANIIETIAQVRAIVEQAKAEFPSTLEVRYLQDKSEQIKTMLGDLENNVISAIVLVMIVIIAVLGFRPSLLIGAAIPGSFLAAMVVIYFFGMTLNIVVLFSLILVVGMLVDGAIVTIELADRKLDEGESAKTAFASASKRMAWPIIASTATTLAVFFPLLVWPGLVGEFMKFMPLTVIITLLASLLMALIFIPVLGSLIVKRKANKQTNESKSIKAAEDGNLEDISGWVAHYLSVLNTVLNHPAKTAMGALAALFVAYTSYIFFGKGLEFFPSVEPEFLQVQVQARGDLSIHERDALVAEVEHTLLNLDHLKSVYTRTLGGGSQSQDDIPEDVIGIIQLELTDWQVRPTAKELSKVIRDKTAHIPGIKIQIREPDSGPSTGKPIQLNVSSQGTSNIVEGVEHMLGIMSSIDGFVDIEDSRPLPSIEWRLIVNRERAAVFGVDVTLLGNTVTLITNGALLAEYRPDDAEEEVEIRLRFPPEYRNIEQLYKLRIPSANGAVPISNFVTIEPAAKVGVLKRTDGTRSLSIKANIKEGMLADDLVKQVKQALSENPLPQGIFLNFKGQDEDTQQAIVFLSTAFIGSIFFMLIILLTQFNSFYQAFVVLSAIVFSTAGVLLGLLVSNEAFGVVMSGLGVIALAGIVVNNNIVLIDTFNDLKSRSQTIKEAILRTAAQRIRPVLLTSVTTILGLIPMVFALTIDIVDRNITVGAPSAQWWTALASTIAGGLTFATILTLLLTPALLMLGENLRQKLRRS